jgi:hypothetical protein
MSKMMKDALVGLAVVGAFVTAAFGLTREIARPWPAPTANQSAAVVAQGDADSDCYPGAVTYVITAQQGTTAER